MKIGEFKWDCKRVWWDAQAGKTENGFAISDDGETLVIRNEFYEIAEASVTLPLEPNSKYEFSAEARVTNFERNPKSEIIHPDLVGGAVAEYQSADSGELVIYTPKMHNSPEWGTFRWKVSTNGNTGYLLRLRNGTSQNSCKGTAYFKNLQWKKIAPEARDGESAIAMPTARYYNEM